MNYTLVFNLPCLKAVERLFLLCSSKGADAIGSIRGRGEEWE